jgi:histidinol phosphatase-like PHP family hydrolase
MSKRHISELEKFQNIEPGNVPCIDFHIHTTWTDGANTVREMYDQASKLGLEYILFSEHVRSASTEWFGRYAGEVRSLPCVDCHALLGIETKIADLNGMLDCTPQMIATCDLVMAVVHRFPKADEGTVMDFEEVPTDEAVLLEYRMASAALENPDVDILGHPFGMSYRHYHVCPPEDLMRSLIRKAAANHVAFEINSHYHPDPWKLVEWCREFKTSFSLGSDAHSLDEVGRITRVLQGKEPAWNLSVS